MSCSRFAVWPFALWVLTLAALAQTTDDLFDDSVVHETRLTMKAADWQALKDHYLENTYYNVDTFQWRNITLNNITIRSRGHGSRSPIKPGLHVDFNRNVKGQKFLGLSAIEYKSNTQDATLLHERLAMRMFLRMGLPASREVSAKLYVNDEYIGLYNLVETIDSDYLTRWFKEGNGYLYEFKPVDTGYHFEYLGQNLDNYAPLPFAPVTHSNAPDTVTLEGMIRTINNSQAADADYITAMAPYLDLKLWLTHVAIENFVADFDCILGDVFGMNNFDLYRFEGKKLSQFLVWDKDGSFDSSERPIFQNADVNVLVHRLLAIPEYRHTYLEALLRCAALAGGAGGWLEQEVLREYSQIHDAALADPNKFYLVAGILQPSSNDNFEAAVLNLRGYPTRRLAFLLNAVANDGYQLADAAPSLTPGGAVNGLTNVGSFAPGSLATINGGNLGTTNAGSILINGFPAPVSTSATGQVTVQIPWEVAPGQLSIAAVVNGAVSNFVTANIATYAPAIISVVHADYTPVSTDSPAAAREDLIVFASGLGPVNGAMVTGQPAPKDSLVPTTQIASVSIGSAAADVVFSGLTPGALGLYQINIRVPAGVPSGAKAPLIVSIGGQSTPATDLPTK